MSDFNFHSAAMSSTFEACPSCGFSNRIAFDKVSLFNTCQSCGVFYMRTGNRNYTRLENQNYKFSHFVVLGNRLIINAKKYFVSGAVLFAVTNGDADEYNWELIFLYDEEGNASSLMINKGHATHLFNSEFKSVLKNPGSKVEWKGLDYQLFDSYYYTGKAAIGELPIDASIEYNGLDYIHPPYLLTSSMHDYKSIWEEGTYVDINSIESEFHIKAPIKIKSIGVAPNSINKKAETFKTVLKSVAIFNIIWIVFAIFHNANSSTELVAVDNQIYEEKKEQIKVQGSYDWTMGKYPETDSSITKYVPEKKSDSAFNSPSFTLTNYKSNLTFNITSSIVQNWLAIDIFLINEDNGEMSIVSKDLEYYTGIEGGESWSEGSQAATAQLGGLSAGKYHLTYVPHFPDSPVPLSWEVKVYANGQIWSNLIAVIIVSWLIVLVWYIMSSSFEKKRWENSPYGRYS